MNRTHLLGILVLVLIVAAVIVGLSIPIDHKVAAPDYALRSVLIQRLEFIGVLVVAGVGLLLLVSHAFDGRLPRSVSVSGVEWEDKAADITRTTEASITKLREDLDKQAKFIGEEIAPRIDDLEELAFE